MGSMTSLTSTSLVALLDGGSMPHVGFGVALSDDAVKSVKFAIEAGYRHIDSARHYRNEEAVAQAISESKIPRSELFFTTKIMSAEHGTEATARAVDESLARVSTAGSYFDLILLHDPKACPEKRVEAYKALLEAKSLGKTKHIGVSSFGVRHLQDIENAKLTLPTVNQIELHPWNQQKEIVAFCQERKIVLQAFCPLVRSRRMDNPVLVKISEATGKTPGQVLLRWSLQRGFVPLPKSDNPDRIRANIDLYDFELSAEQMDDLNNLDEGAAGACSWNPVDAP